MTKLQVTRRGVMQAAAGAAAIGGSFGIIRPAKAAMTKIVFLTNWFAEAEHGGFYQAKALGLYEKAGLDVEIKMGGPQVNGMQLLTGGAADIIISYDIQVLNSIEKGLPVKAIGAAFQFDLQGMMTHKDIKSLADLKGHKILVASTAYTTFWPWLKQKFGYVDSQSAPYTFNLQPFFADPTIAQQGYVTAEPYEAQEHDIPINFFLFADDGYPPYSNTIVTTNDFLKKNPKAAAAFMRASMEGWKSYLESPGPGNKLIQVDNPKETDGQIAYSVGRLKAIKAVNGGDAATQGIGIMTEARWAKTRDFLVKGGLIKADTDWKSGFTLDYVKNLKIMMG